MNNARAAALLGISVAVSALIACGGNDVGYEQNSPESQIRALIERVAEAGTHADQDAFVALFCKADADAMRATYRPGEFAADIARVRGENDGAMPRMELSNIRIYGDSASATLLTETVKADGTVTNTTSENVEFIVEDSEWRVCGQTDAG